MRRRDKLSNYKVKIKGKQTQRKISRREEDLLDRGLGSGALLGGLKTGSGSENWQ
jgi:hypothetical protein